MAETEPPRDPGLDTLLDLDGQVMVVDPAGRHWVGSQSDACRPRPNVRTG